MDLGGDVRCFSIFGPHLKRVGEQTGAFLRYLRPRSRGSALPDLLLTELDGVYVAQTLKKRYWLR